MVSVTRKRRTARVAKCKRNYFSCLALSAIACALLVNTAFFTHEHLTFTSSEHTSILNEIIFNSKNEQNKTLVILLGTLRCGEEAWDSLYRNLLDVNRADLALMTSINPLPEEIKYANGASLFQRAKYIWTHKEYSDWANAVDDMMHGQKVWRTAHTWPNDTNVMGRGEFPMQHQCSGGIQLVIKWFLSNYIERLGLPDLYERFVITRTDQFYMCPYNLSLLENNYMWIPEGEDYGGVCDRHLVCDNSHILDALRIFPEYIRNPGAIGKIHNSESLHKKIWEQKGLPVRRFKRLMYTCIKRGDHGFIGRFDIKKTRRFDTQSMAYRKYEREYTRSRARCTEGENLKSNFTL